MKCPHCTVAYNSNPQYVDIGRDAYDGWYIIRDYCPECKRCNFKIQNQRGTIEYLVYPKGVARVPLPSSVPEKYQKEYIEACTVLPDSAKASAAISRRCLQTLIREELKIQKKDLFQEIDEIIKQNRLPSYLAEGVDAIRNIGNFAAHPIKSTNTGEIVEVEPGEAEWLLDLLEGLFDFLFVQPEIIKKKRESLNQKLKDAGKPEML